MADRRRRMPKHKPHMPARGLRITPLGAAVLRGESVEPLDHLLGIALVTGAPGLEYSGGCWRLNDRAAETPEALLDALEDS